MIKIVWESYLGVEVASVEGAPEIRGWRQSHGPWTVALAGQYNSGDAEADGLQAQRTVEALMKLGASPERLQAVIDLLECREAADAKFGENRDYDDGLPGPKWETTSLAALRAINDKDERAGTQRWLSILMEEVAEVAEAVEAQDADELWEELVDVAQVALAWLEALVRREAGVGRG